MVIEGKSIKEILNTPVEKYYSMGLISTRAFNCCQYNDINTIADLALYHRNKGLLCLRNCGKIILKELEYLLDGIDLDKVGLALEHSVKYEHVPKEIKAIIENKLQSPYSNSKTPEDLYCFFCVDQNDLANKFHSLKCLEEKRCHYQILSDICSEMKNANLTVSFDYELFVIAKAILWFCNDQTMIEIIEMEPSVQLRMDILNAVFANKASMLSTRAKKIQKERIPSYLKVISLFQMTKKQLEEFLTPGRHAIKTTEELFAFVDALKENLMRFENLDDYYISKQYALLRFPYLSEEHVDFVVNFNAQYGHYPMFYLLRQSMSMPKEREDVIFVMSTGLLDKQCKTLEEIGEQFDLTRERIRQILMAVSHKLFEVKEWEKYPFANEHEITQEDESFLNVVNNEKVDMTFETFAQICSRGFHFKIAKEKGVIKKVYKP